MVDAAGFLGILPENCGDALSVGDMLDQSSSANERRPASVARRVWKAPAQNGSVLADPDWERLPQRIDDNRHWFERQPFDRSIDWAGWRQRAREELLAAAVSYTARDTGRHDLSPAGPLIVDGHQPELFHPGVWAKNFAIARLARRCQGTALHLIVDNDVLSRTFILAPDGSAAEPHLRPEPFDRRPAACPWEEARIADPACWTTFADRITDRMARWNIAPLALSAWPAALAAAERTDSLSEGLNAARRHIERRWGVENLELPVSGLSDTQAFHEFAVQLFSRADDVRVHYNAVVQEYRRVNRVRSRSHPVPDLAIDADWCEVPFRLWRTGDARRQRAYVRRCDSQWQLRDEHGLVASWSDSFEAALAALAALPNRGIRLRPRALTLTLFARLLLADLFVHGLGGAKYDEMTDALAARLFGAPPPPYLTVSATVWLPFDDTRQTLCAQCADVGQLRHRLRQLQHNPQRFAGAVPAQLGLLAAEKQSLLAAQNVGDRSVRRQRYLRLRELNAAMSALLGDLRTELTNSLAAAEQWRQARRVLQNREFSWVLFPEDTLRSFYETTFPA